jgi:hypothetical protein
MRLSYQRDAFDARRLAAWTAERQATGLAMLVAWSRGDDCAMGQPTMFALRLHGRKVLQLLRRTRSARRAACAQPIFAMAWIFATDSPYAAIGAWLVVGAMSVGLVRAIVLAARGRRRARPAPLRLRWQGTPESFRAEPHHWALVTALMFSLRNGNAWDSLALDAPVEETRDCLREAWNITDRASLMRQLHSLFVEGHRAHLQAMVEHYAGCTGEAFAQEYAEQDREARVSGDPEAREWLWQMRAARDNRNGVQVLDFLAWDMVRFVMLCQNGLRLGLISEPEARDFVLLPARLMQERYRGWLDCAEQFMFAREFWAGGNPEMAGSQDAVRRSIALLRRDRNSPWQRVPWEMPLPAPPSTFARRLQQMRLLAPLPEQEQHAANPFALMLDDALRA